MSPPPPQMISLLNCVNIEKAFSFPREKQDQKETTAQRFLKCIAINKPIYQTIFS